MSDPEPTPIHRIDESPSGVRVVTKAVSDLYGEWPDGRQNVLTREYPDLFTHVVSGRQDGTGQLRIGCAAHVVDCSGWQIHGGNGIYAEVSFEERELTDAERSYCEDTFSYRDVETVVEFAMPHPEELRAAVVANDHQDVYCFESVIDDADRRHDVLTGLQERIAQEDFRANQLHPRRGLGLGLAPEWDPSNSHNDGRDAAHLEDMASMRQDAHLCDFDSIAGFPYAAFRNARHRVLEIHEPRLEPYEHVPLDVAGYPEWAYCRECGATGPEERFLHVDLERRNETRRVCDRCADSRVEFGHDPCYTAENVARARDDRVQEHGGQRNLVGEYGGESDDGH